MANPETIVDFGPQAKSLLARGIEAPSVAIILGSGLGEFANHLDGAVRVPVSEIHGYPHSTVAGHAGALCFGRIKEGNSSSPPLVVFQGRVHYYESGNLSTAVAPIRLTHALGAKTILITNAAGGIDRSLHPGDLMLIDDVITLNPASSVPQPEPGPTRKDSLLDPRLKDILRESSRELKVPLQQGTYAWVHGPSYETAAEIRMLGSIGAHAVGMSTVPELVEAHRLGLHAAGVSLVSNMGTGISESKLTHDEVTAVAREASQRFTALLRHALIRFPHEPATA